MTKKEYAAAHHNLDLLLGEYLKEHRGKTTMSTTALELLVWVVEKTTAQAGEACPYTPYKFVLP